ncbi:TIGR03621 family F420-dependent LLM class oxidoreductase [Kibdelosporangium philippinense]|uniref:TIGR03621 family F420-dependent LLM class oxidoreductase n=1 Tax=Kibdelosporangium philippinense TaxID=211113 RepID=A0ABS8ZYZ8_9PSEU|nr:TIGR03621 family F420-dependent LLM class oxidoreductase [Kibdelosporangium philippinense]MCE7011442.1 TIGR03621 family F420-dependent LLM class oxidoreductase [Kibdelosporangium philippinense]
MLIALGRRAEELGYDVILMPDHLSMGAPFPSLTLTAEVTTRPRLGTFVLNAGFWNPTLLARDAFAVNTYSEGRLELGLGAGYVREEFVEAGLGWPSAGERVTHLVDTVHKIRTAAEKVGQSMPIMVGGNGDRVLRLAAEQADIVAFAGLKAVPDQTPPLAFITADELDERVKFVQQAAGGRDYESNLLIQSVVVTDDRRGAIEEQIRQFGLDITADFLLDVPAMLVGTYEQIAEQLRAQRDRFGISYVTVLEPAYEAFGPVIPMLRE